MLNGEDQAFAQCYELTSAIVYSAIFRICQNKDSAQDILQETYIKAFSSLNNLQEHSHFLTWIKRIAFNQTISWIRKNHKPLLDTEELTPEQTLESEKELAEQIAVHNDLTKLLGVLSPHARSVLWLYAIEGYSHQEIAKMHGKSVSYSKVIVSRALNLIKAKTESVSNA